MTPLNLDSQKSHLPNSCGKVILRSTGSPLTTTQQFQELPMVVLRGCPAPCRHTCAKCSPNVLIYEMWCSWTITVLIADLLPVIFLIRKGVFVNESNAGCFLSLRWLTLTLRDHSDVSGTQELFIGFLYRLSNVFFFFSNRKITFLRAYCNEPLMAA